MLLTKCNLVPDKCTMLTACNFTEVAQLIAQLGRSGRVACTEQLCWWVFCAVQSLTLNKFYTLQGIRSSVRQATGMGIGGAHTEVQIGRNIDHQWWIRWSIIEMVWMCFEWFKCFRKFDFLLWWLKSEIWPQKNAIKIENMQTDIKFGGLTSIQSASQAQYLVTLTVVCVRWTVISIL